MAVATVAATLIPAITTTATTAHAESDNLLVNGDAEMGDLIGWDLSGLGWVGTYGNSDGLGYADAARPMGASTCSGWARRAAAGRH
jgi:hypothetical protein